MAYYNFYMTTSSGNWIIFPCSRTGEHHMKLVGSNFKANRRRYFFVQHVWVQWLNSLPQEVEDAIRQTDKGTQKNPVICKPQTTESQRIILGKFLFISWASAAGHHFFCFFVLWGNKIFQVSICTVSYICQASQTPTRISKVPFLLSCPMVEDQEITPR